MSLKHLSRWQAFIAHSAISVLIFIVLLSFIIFSWYPGFLFDTDGGWQGLQLILGVDLILGPLLTLIVFKPGKPGLSKDITLIALVQSTCLTLGTYTIYDQKPLAIVFSDDTFFSVSRGTFTFAEQPLEVLENFTGTYPKQIFIDLPASKEERKALRKAQLNDGPLHARTTLFRPYLDHFDKALDWGEINLTSWLQNTENNKNLYNWLSQNNLSIERIALIPYIGRYKQAHLIIDKNNGNIIGKFPMIVNNS